MKKKKRKSFDADSSKCKLQRQHGPRLEQILADALQEGSEPAAEASSIWWMFTAGVVAGLLLPDRQSASIRATLCMGRGENT